MSMTVDSYQQDVAIRLRATTILDIIPVCAQKSAYPDLETAKISKNSVGSMLIAEHQKLKN